MEKILADCGKLEQIGKSNNSVIYKLLNKEGNPNGKVLKLVMHSTPNTHSKECEHLHNEAHILSQVRHPSVIKSHGEILSNVAIKNSHFCALQLELADTDFFDKIAKTYPNPVEPKYIRTAFAQILRALDHLHNDLQIAHNDIKLENVFLFRNKVKLADFGFAKCQKQQQNLDINDKYAQWKNRCKTPLAPEILSFIGQKQNGKGFCEKKADVFALGVALFQALFLRAPFLGDYCSENDGYFGCFFQGKSKQFWEQEEISNTLRYLNQFEDFRQDSFIDLMNKMFEVDGDKRISIKQILKHPWFKQVNSEQNGNNIAGCTQF